MTAPTISLTDGTTTVNLNSGSILTTRHQFGTAQLLQEDIEVGRDKQNLSITGYQNATESIDLLITAASAALVSASIQSIEELLDTARQSTRTWNNKHIYLQVQHAGDASAWRSEVLAGTLELGDVLDQIGRFKVEATLIVTRRFYWEGARTALELSTYTDGTPSTSERTLHNADCSSTLKNYIDIDSTEVDGNLPTPIELHLRNGGAGSVDWDAYHLANYVFCTPASVDPIYLGSEVVDGSGAETWVSDDETLTHRWLISDTQAGYWAGQYVRMIAIVSNSPSGCYLRAAVCFDDTLGVPIYKAGSQVYVDGSGTYDLGVFPLPPGVIDDAYDISVAIYGQAEGGDSVTIDHIHLMPAGAGLYRYIKQLGFSVSTTGSMVEDGPEGLVYIGDSSYRAPVLKGYYEPLHIWPGVDNRIRVWIEGPSAEDDVLEAQAWYRPRRLSV